MRAVLRMLQKFNNGLYRVVVVVSAVTIAMAVLVVAGGALTRYLTGRGFSTALELPPMLLPWVVFPLAGALMRTSAHITVDVLPAMLSPARKRVLDGVLAVVAIIAGAIFCVAGMEAVALFRLTGQLTEMEWEFPIWWVYLSFPVGFAILIVSALEMLLTALLGEHAEGTAEEAEAQSYGA